jgi:hypothetical protein
MGTCMSKVNKTKKPAESGVPPIQDQTNKIENQDSSPIENVLPSRVNTQ